MCEKCEACSDVVEILTDNGYCLECEAEIQQSLIAFDAVEDEMYAAYLANALCAGCGEVVGVGEYLCCKCVHESVPVVIQPVYG